MKKQELYDECERLFGIVNNVSKQLEIMLEEYKKDISKYDTIYFYGCGLDAKLAYDSLADILVGKEIYFIDGNSDKHGKEIIPGHICYGKEKMFGCNSATTLILVTTSQYCLDVLKDYNCSVISPINWQCTVGSEWQDRLGGTLFDIGYIQLLVQLRGSRAYGDDSNGFSKKQKYKDKFLKVFELFDDEQSRDILGVRLRDYLFGFRFYSQLKTLPQYFPKEVLERISEGATFIDCGAFIGDTVEEFRRQVKDNFNKIYAFEMDSLNFAKLKNYPATQDDRITLINKGVSDKKRRVPYRKMATSASSYVFVYDDTLSDYAELVSVDELIKDCAIKEKVSFVKMDIEGAEMDALRGMKEMIVRDKPTLAICVYHKPNDIWEIPLYIHELVPEYKMMLRHHSDLSTETVLYAYLN